MYETSDPNGAAHQPSTPAPRAGPTPIRSAPISPSSSPTRPTSSSSSRAAGRCSTTASSATRRATIRRATGSRRSTATASPISAARCLRRRARSRPIRTGDAGTGRTVFTDIAGRVFIHLPLALAAVMPGAAARRRFRFSPGAKPHCGKPLLVAAAMTSGGILGAWLVSWIVTVCCALATSGAPIRWSPISRVYAVLLLAWLRSMLAWAPDIDRTGCARPHGC